MLSLSVCVFLPLYFKASLEGDTILIISSVFTGASKGSLGGVSVYGQGFDAASSQPLYLQKDLWMLEGDSAVAHFRASAQAGGLACIFFKHISHNIVFNCSLEILSKYLSYVIPNSRYNLLNYQDPINCYCYPHFTDEK